MQRAIYFSICAAMCLWCQPQTQTTASAPKLMYEYKTKNTTAIDRMICVSQDVFSDKKRIADLMIRFLNRDKAYKLRRLSIGICDKVAPLAQAVGDESSAIGFVGYRGGKYDVVLQSGKQDPRRILVGPNAYEIFSFHLYGSGPYSDWAWFEIRTATKPTPVAADQLAAQIAILMPGIKCTVSIWWGYEIPSGPASIPSAPIDVPPYYFCYEARCRLFLSHE